MADQRGDEKPAQLIAAHLQKSCVVVCRGKVQNLKHEQVLPQFAFHAFKACTSVCREPTYSESGWELPVLHGKLGWTPMYTGNRVNVVIRGALKLLWWLWTLSPNQRRFYLTCHSVPNLWRLFWSLWTGTQFVLLMWVVCRTIGGSITFGSVTGS